MEKLLSIVVPVYKVEDYINKCLDSIVLDNPYLMERLEVIIVNDGTPDNSAKMSREYVHRYPNSFRQIDKENGGHGSAWNLGLKEANGKYLRFLDSDDWFTNLDRLLLDLETCDADIVFNPFVKVYSYENREETIDSPIAPGSNDIPDCWGSMKVNFWGTTYKTCILQPLYPLFAERVMFDDFILTWAPLILGRTYAAFNYPVYNYLIGRDGQTMLMSKQKRGAISYCKCFEQYEIVRARIDEHLIPEDNLHHIDSSIAGYASYIFSYMYYLQYSEAKNRMEYLWKKYLKDYPYKSNLEKRYGKMPFLLFYILEFGRRMKNRL